MGVLQSQTGLVDEVTRVAQGHRPPRLYHPGQIQALRVLHGENEARAAAEGGVGGDDVGVLEPGDGADLTQEAVEDAGSFDDFAADQLEHLVSAQETVVGEEDDPHSAATQLADDLVVGVVGQLTGKRAHRVRGRRGGRAPWPRQRGPARCDRHLI